MVFRSRKVFVTFCAMNSTTSKATPRQPAAILAVRRFVEASTKSIPQNEEPRSKCVKSVKHISAPGIEVWYKMESPQIDYRKNK